MTRDVKMAYVPGSVAVDGMSLEVGRFGVLIPRSNQAMLGLKWKGSDGTRNSKFSSNQTIIGLKLISRGDTFHIQYVQIRPK